LTPNKVVLYFAGTKQRWKVSSKSIQNCSRMDYGARTERQKRRKPRRRFEVCANVSIATRGTIIRLGYNWYPAHPSNDAKDRPRWSVQTRRRHNNKGIYWRWGGGYASKERRLIVPAVDDRRIIINIEQYVHSCNNDTASSIPTTDQLRQQHGLQALETVVYVAVYSRVSHRPTLEHLAQHFTAWYTTRVTPRFYEIKPLQQIGHIYLRSSVRKRQKEMAQMRILAPIGWLVIVMLAGNEAHQQPKKLKTCPSDAAALCALDTPTLSAAMSPSMPEAPEAVRCGMTCATNVGCKHFNYVSTQSSPCQLYHYKPTNFDVSPNCQYYYEPGLQLYQIYRLLMFTWLVMVI